MHWILLGGVDSQGEEKSDRDVAFQMLSDNVTDTIKQVSEWETSNE